MKLTLIQSFDLFSIKPIYSKSWKLNDDNNLNWRAALNWKCEMLFLRCLASFAVCLCPTKHSVNLFFFTKEHYFWSPSSLLQGDPNWNTGNWCGNISETMHIWHFGNTKMCLRNEIYLLWINSCETS